MSSTSLPLLIFLIMCLRGTISTQPIRQVYQNIPCLNQTPLTKQCLYSIRPSQILEPSIRTTLCSSSLKAGYLDKAEQFCASCKLESQDCAFFDFLVSIRSNRLEEALQKEYLLFFTNPFKHELLFHANMQTLEESLQPLHVDSLESHNQKAIYYYYSNQTANSLQHLQLFLSSNTKVNPHIWQNFLMVRLLEKQSQYTQALEFIKNAIEQSKSEEEGSHFYLHHLKGNFLMHHLKYKEAIQQFEMSNAIIAYSYRHLSPQGFVLSHYNIGLCFQKLGETKKALEQYKKSVSLFPSPDNLNALGHAYYSLFKHFPEDKSRKEYFTQAEKYYKRSLKQRPSYELALYNIGVLYMEAGEPAHKYLPIFQKCVDAFKNCQYGLIRAYFKLGQKGQAEKVIESMKKDETILGEISSLLYDFEAHTYTLELLQKYRKDHPNIMELKSADLMEWKGMHEFALGKHEEAEYSLQRAVFLGAKSGHVYFNLGMAQKQLNKYQACRRSFASAQKIDPRPETKQELKECEEKEKKEKLKGEL